jgi:hypothetical protein
VKLDMMIIPSKFGSRANVSKVSFPFSDGGITGLGLRIICIVMKKNNAMHAAASSRIGLANAIFER